MNGKAGTAVSLLLRIRCLVTTTAIIMKLGERLFCFAVGYIRPFSLVRHVQNTNLYDKIHNQGDRWKLQVLLEIICLLVSTSRKVSDGQKFATQFHHHGIDREVRTNYHDQTVKRN